MVSTTPSLDQQVNKIEKLKLDEKDAMRSRQMAKALAEWSNSNTASREYHLGVEDILEIGILSFEEPGEISKLIRPIQQDGTVSIPWVGSILVAGLSVVEARNRLAKELDGRYLRNPEVTLIVSQYRSAPVVITGAASKPGIYYLKNDRRSILEMLAEADGLSHQSGDVIFLMRSRAVTTGSVASVSTNLTSEGDKGVITIDMDQLIDHGDLRLNLWVTKGDIIFIPPRAKEFVYILGYVLRPGAYEIDAVHPPSALQAVALAGGLSTNARAENSFLLRQGPLGQTMVEVDLTKMASKDGIPLALRPGDTLVVGTGFFARMSEFVRPSVGAGVNYAPTL